MPTNDLALIVGQIGVLFGLLAFVGLAKKTTGYECTVAWKHLVIFTLSIACLGFSVGLDTSIIYSMALLFVFISALLCAHKLVAQRIKNPR